MKALFESTGSNNIAIGWNAGGVLTTGNNNIYLGSGGQASEESNAIRIGSNQTKAFLAGVATSAVTGSTVVVNGEGQLGTTPSSRHFKKDIRPVGAQVKGLMELRPVSFRYRDSVAQGPNPLQFGLIAEQVEKVYPNLVIHGRDGRPSAVAYQELPSLLLAQVQKQQRQNNALRAQNRSQQQQLSHQQTQNHHLQAEIDWLIRQVRRR